MKDLLFGIDLGSNSLKAVILNKEPEGGRVLVTHRKNSRGFQNGELIDTNEFSQGLDEFLAELENMANQRIREVVITFNLKGIKNRIQRGSVIVAGESVQEDDVERAYQSAKVGTVPANRTLVYAVPLSFSVNGERDLRDPIGLKGSRLEVELLMVDCLSIFINKIQEVFHTLGVKINNFQLSVISASAVCLTEKNKESGVALVDFGHRLTTLAVFKNGHLICLENFEFGSNSFTEELAMKYKLSLEEAEEFKQSLNLSSSKEKIKIGEEEISQKSIVKLFEKKAQELFGEIYSFLKENNLHKLPAGLVLTGGGMKLKNFSSLIKRTTNLPIHIAKDLTGNLSQEQIEFIPALGVCLLSQDIQPQSFYEKIKNFIRNFLP